MNNFLEAKNLKEMSQKSLKLFFWTFPLSFVAILPLYIFHIEIFNVFKLLKFILIVGLRSIFVYILIISIISIFKEIVKK
jgi:hypothetical protein